MGCAARSIGYVLQEATKYTTLGDSASNGVRKKSHRHFDCRGVPTSWLEIGYSHIYHSLIERHVQEMR